MNRAFFYNWLAEIESEYKQRIAQGADRTRYDAILLAIFKEQHMPNLPLIRAVIHSGGDSRIALHATMERAWREYAYDLIRRVRASFGDFMDERGIHPDNVAGFAERHNLSPSEADWVLKFRRDELSWTLNLGERLDGFLL